MTKTFYVAGKVGAGETKVSQIAEQMTEEGWTQIFDWTTLPDVQKPYLDHRDTNEDPAQQMVTAVSNCDLFIYVDDPSIFGGLIETGIAIGKGKTVVLYGRNIRQSIFWCLPNVMIAQNMKELSDIAADCFV